MNKNKVVLVTVLAVIIGLVAVLCTGCIQIAGVSDIPDIDSIGRVYIVGNEPVTQAVYRDNSGQYQIDNGYQNLSGYLIHVTGDITGDGIYGECLDILSVEIVH
jgi:hypothetical protein